MTAPTLQALFEARRQEFAVDGDIVRLGLDACARPVDVDARRGRHMERPRLPAVGGVRDVRGAVVDDDAGNATAGTVGSAEGLSGVEQPVDQGIDERKA